MIGFIVAFGVLLDALVVRSLLVPALAYDVGRWIWWPSRLSRERDHADPETAQMLGDPPPRPHGGTHRAWIFGSPVSSGPSGRSKGTTCTGLPAISTH